jgi:SAM-dependent methyltransferase
VSLAEAEENSGGGDAGSHERVLRRSDLQGVLALLDKLGAPRGARILEVSCRHGELLRELNRRGFDARGTRFETNLPPIGELAIDNGVDLIRGLPYPDGSFDVVIITDVIEHLEPHARLISELARIVKSGGYLIISTVNVMRLDSRLAFLLSGFHKTKRRVMPFDTPLGDARLYHNHPVMFPYLYYLLIRNGLELTALGRSRVKAIAYFLYPLFLPLVALNTWFLLMKRQRRYLVRHNRARPSLALNRKLLGWMLSRQVLMHDHLILAARKLNS